MSDLFPPFAPDPDEPKRRLFKPIPLRLLVPNLITLLALCLGLTAIRLAIEERLELAIFAIAVAAVLDGLDGRIARLLKGTSRFGAELDSLSDFVNFGVAPPMLLYVFILHDMRSLGWIAALVFAIAAALRLARFNVMLDDPNRPEWQKHFFVGMAAPAGAVTVMLPLYLNFVGIPGGGLPAPVVGVYVVLIAFLMVSRIPTFSGKTFGSRVPRELVLPLFVLVVLFAALFVSFTFEVLAVCTLVYLGALPFGFMRYRALEKADRLEKSAARAGGLKTPSAADGPPPTL
ncbi:MAG: CDP-diacylglycerol--serine O-phosphatidyltransferase [Chelatococcus sp.]|jgi:CDP-diacylglycerol--serine O-phosphatidyltransferase|uniref:CDP-diacylglycerol--serine O-phosphatidyltransferase n=1 Tax=unclassified Chelatococcus TaxID=2638111 RepID=UPI001BD1B315|nr:MULTISPECIES: CDP-diacylglycerol--serine O-phosphatidyltransferase [unclassified Chelatococcus]CAH1670407.1 CDP-diacylglycerol--serine O-phosphatidyltransferase [Hyphomicrobiales bacterium]MBS7739210.1 CDP-diacylglycerol--serine O-phosphatidyltransferase [Chelatococcus sp. HY11]MBX3540825.1 CDP-diacylglycerol--serine O-phosphatidyltransferase [Chelatococcus sp.]MBX3543700.1 CDP-diacylglycerol--serine O-phosphatidyltransferase [Chelatococcus sp.]MCO5076257.1 CDP-diacylglycerol--serine O-phos